MMDELLQRAMNKHPGEVIAPIGVTTEEDSYYLWYHVGKCKSTRLVKMRKDTSHDADSVNRSTRATR